MMSGSSHTSYPPGKLRYFCVRRSAFSCLLPSLGKPLGVMVFSPGRLEGLLLIHSVGLACPRSDIMEGVSGRTVIETEPVVSQSVVGSLGGRLRQACPPEKS